MEATLDLHDLGFLALEGLVDLGDVRVGRLLDLALGAPDLVLRGLAFLAEPLELVVRVAADVADRDAGLLGVVLAQLDELLAALLGERRERARGSSGRRCWG